MYQIPDVNPDSMNAELNYRRERLVGAHVPGEPRARRLRLRRNRLRAA